MATKKKSVSSKRRVFIVEDHPVFREGLVRMLGREKDLEICGEAGDYEKGIKGIQQLKPDLVLVDLELPGKSGLDLIKKVRSSKQDVKMLVVSMYDEALYADRVLRAGGDGYIMKEESPDEIIHAIRDVLAGHIYVSEDVMDGNVEVTEKVIAEPEQRTLDQLTDLELNVLELLGRGQNNNEIADKLSLKSREVASHCVQVRKKLKLKTDNALIHYAVRWVETGAV
ncbi:MAG TPA: response regulator transcription factor [Candidatus Acidoferrales bacterium]|jgi:DNA-binding NarL/FixJ family response regulator|nr:response regulator transcription factor [Candidatus Acidoferrales bacterium]